MTKKIVVTAILVMLVITATTYLLGYHGERSFATAGILPRVDTVVKNARTLIGVPYDPLMGMHGNIGANAGFVVCSDVPNIAYGLSGFSLQKMLKDDFAKRPDAYDSDNGNKPGNPYFHRRARNLYAYFAANNRLLSPTGIPVVGDLAFYRRRPNAYISHVALVTETGSNGYRVMESAPGTVLAQEVAGESPIERGWLLVGFGRLYTHVEKTTNESK